MINKVIDATNFFNKESFDKDDFNLKIFFVKINPNVPSSSEIRIIPIDEINKSVERYYLMSSDVENITRASENIPANNQSEEKEEIEIKLTPETTSTLNENQKLNLHQMLQVHRNQQLMATLIGKDIHTGDDVYWDTNDLTNYSLLVTGDSDKENLIIKRIVTQSTKNDAPCFIINVKGDDFDERFAKEYKFNYLDAGDEGLLIHLCH